MYVRSGTNYPLHRQNLTNYKCTTTKKSYCARTFWSALWDESGECNRLVFCQKLSLIMFWKLCHFTKRIMSTQEIIFEEARRDNASHFFLAQLSWRLKWTFIDLNLSVVCHRCRHCCSIKLLYIFVFCWGTI